MSSLCKFSTNRSLNIEFIKFNVCHGVEQHYLIPVVGSGIRAVFKFRRRVSHRRKCWIVAFLNSFFLELFKVKAKVWCVLLPVVKREGGRGREGEEGEHQQAQVQFRLKATLMFNLAVKEFQFSQFQTLVPGLKSLKRESPDPPDFELEFCCGYARLALSDGGGGPASASATATATAGSNGGAGMSEPLSSDRPQQQREFLLNLSPFDLSAQRKAAAWPCSKRRSP